MRAAMFHDRGDVRVESVPDPTPVHGELLVEVRATGICGTDAHEYAHGPVMFPVHQRHPVNGHVGPMIPGDRFVPDGLVPLAEGRSRRVKTLVDPWADASRDTRT